MNQMKNIFCALLAVAFLAGFASTPEVTTYVDPNTNQRTDLLSENELPSPGGGQPREIIWLNASRMPVSRTKFQTYLEVMYAANAESRTCLTRSLNVGDSPKLVLMGIMLTNSPIIGSSSTRLRPAIGVPTRMSFWPV